MSEDASHRLKARKRALRRAAIERRDLLSAGERSAKSERIVDRVLALPEVGAARTVMAFWSFGSEVQTAALIQRLHDAGKRVVLPRIAEGEIAAVTYAPGDPVAATSFGAMEPVGAEFVPAVDVDVVIVPGVAFDRRGGRVGYGGGFYDRLLSRAPSAPAVAVAFDVQLVDAVPQGQSDSRVDVIVTEDEVIRPRHDTRA
ncbi:MAG: 5-formyltetrahydrofolate cyclo-ligase [Actinomycetota bacterium]